MDSYKKQWYPGCPNGIGTYSWESAMGLDMSSEPGTVIRPDIPLGSGPARHMKPLKDKSPVRPQEKPVRNKEVSKGPRPLRYSQNLMNCEPMPMRYSPNPIHSVMPMECPKKPEESGTKPMKCPEKPGESGTVPEKFPERPAQYGMPMRRSYKPIGAAQCRCPYKTPMPNPSVSMKDIDCLPIAMAYVPWQYWNEVYSVETAICRGTIFPDLDKPFMGGCS